MDEFFTFLGEERSKRVRLAVMDMWKPFRNSANKKAPQAAILFDKFHILKHLGGALDKVRKQEYAKLDGQKRKFIKGQKYVLLEPAGQRSKEPQDPVGCQQAAQYRLRAKGIIRPALGLQERSLGSEILQQLARSAQVAAPEAL